MVNKSQKFVAAELNNWLNPFQNLSNCAIGLIQMQVNRLFIEFYRELNFDKVSENFDYLQFDLWCALDQERK